MIQAHTIVSDWLPRLKLELFLYMYNAAKQLGFPLLNAYIDSIGTSYGHGANFAAGSSTIRRQNKTFFDGGTPFTLEIQTAQFHQFKARTAKFFNQSGW